MRRYLFPLIIVGIFLAPTAVSAVGWFPIVPCGVGGAPACTTCDLFKTFKNIIDLVLYGVTGPIAAFMIVWAGGLMLLGGAKPDLYGQGTKMLKNTLIGVSIILLSWLATNTLIKTLAVGNSFDTWYEFSCPAYLQPPEEAAISAPVAPKGDAEHPAPELLAALAATCNPANLAKAYGVPNNTTLVSNSATALSTCIQGDAVVRALLDTSQIFTYERSNPLCNLTRGYPVCGACQHSKDSCHYGGKTGRQGAEAVDFNWNGKSVQYVIQTRSIVAKGGEPCKTHPDECRVATGEEGLFDEIYRTVVNNRCDYKFIQFEPGSKGGHTHVSTIDCTSDGSGVGKKRAPPIIP